MAFSRYSGSPVLGLGSQYGTSQMVVSIRNAIKDGSITVKQVIARGAARLDTIAGEEYGDARYWWVLAAASNVGWGLQVPAGTVISVPSFDDISRIVG